MSEKSAAENRYIHLFGDVYQRRGSYDDSI